MPQRLKLSIVVPSYNQAAYIGATLESLNQQRGLRTGEFEVIVIDGGSTDDTVDILRQWAPKLPLQWVSEADRGQTDALIKGFRRSTGDVLGWLCSDDLLEPMTIRQVLDIFTNDPAMHFVYGDGIWISADGRVIRPKKEIPFNWFIWLNDHNYIPQPAAFWRRALYEKVGGLDASFSVAMDGDLFARFANMVQPIHVRRQWARMRRYPEQKNQRLRRFSDDEDRIIRQRMGFSYHNTVSVFVRRLVAKVWRVGWKLARAAYW